MSIAPSRLLIAFQGEVSCESLRGGVDWRLRGVTHATSADAPVEHADLWLFTTRCSGAALPLPHGLRDLSVHSMEGAGHCELLLEAHEGSFTVQARRVRLHRDVAPTFFAAVPPARVSRRTRAAWALLLGLLRFRPLSKLLIRSAG